MGRQSLRGRGWSRLTCRLSGIGPNHGAGSSRSALRHSKNGVQLCCWRQRGGHSRFAWGAASERDCRTHHACSGPTSAAI